MNTSHFFRFWIIYAKGFYCDSSDLLILQWSVGIVGRGFGDLVHNVHTLNDLAKSCIGAIQMGCILVHDKELGSGGIRHHASCHGKNAFCML